MGEIKKSRLKVNKIVLYIIFILLCLKYLFDLTKIDCLIYLIVKSLYNIIEMRKIKHFICVSFQFMFCLVFSRMNKFKKKDINN